MTNDKIIEKLEYIQELDELAHMGVVLQDLQDIMEALSKTR